MGNSPSVPKPRARDPEGVEAGAGVGGKTAVGLRSSAPTPTSCPPNCSCHHILPSRRCGGGESSCGGTRTWDPLWHLSLSAPGASARVPTSGPRQRRALLCHTGLTPADSAIPHPNSAPKWSRRTPDSTPVFGYHDYQCRNEVISRVCTILTHTAAYVYTFAKRAPRQLCKALHSCRNSEAGKEKYLRNPNQQASAS